MHIIFYFMLFREYKLCLPRREVEEVDNLRDEWVKLMALAEKVSHLENNLSMLTSYLKRKCFIDHLLYLGFPYNP